MKYVVTIEEVLKKEINVEAESLEEAIDKVRKDYHDCKIILTADDFSYKNIAGREYVEYDNVRNWNTTRFSDRAVKLAAIRLKTSIYKAMELINNFDRGPNHGDIDDVVDEIENSEGY